MIVFTYKYNLIMKKLKIIFEHYFTKLGFLQKKPGAEGLKWYDKRDVYMLSTIHYSSMVSIDKRNLLTGEEKLKPLCVKEYNQCL